MLVERLIAVAVILQTSEMFAIRESFSDDGVWSWSVLKDEFEFFPGPVRFFLDLTLAYPNFLVVLFLRILAASAALMLSHAVLVFTLLLTSVLVCLRWRGVFNGGSDYMTVVVLLALLLARLFPESHLVGLGCLLYIALQLLSSFFIAGVVKLKRVNWRSGRALGGFLCSGIYPVSPLLRAFAEKPALLACLSWSIILFEVLFPLSLLNQSICLLFIITALLFHVANVYMFGLNRFLFAWGAAYPALYYCSGVSWS